MRPGAGPLQVALVPAPSPLRVVTDPPGAEALLNGAAKGARRWTWRFRAKAPRSWSCASRAALEWTRVLDRGAPLPAVHPVGTRHGRGARRHRCPPGRRPSWRAAGPG